MIYHVTLSSESPPTIFASVGFLSSMDADVVPQTCSLSESFATVWMGAFVGLYSKMDIAVSRQRGHRIERLATTRVFALVLALHLTM